MNIHLLEEEELLVECEIRHIPASSNAHQLLVAKLECEKRFPILVPMTPHDRANRNPNHELKLLWLKIKRIHSLIHDTLKPLEPNIVQTLDSRLIHIINRLERFQTLQFEMDTVHKLINDSMQASELIKTIRQNTNLISSADDVNPNVLVAMETANLESYHRPSTNPEINLQAIIDEFDTPNRSNRVPILNNFDPAENAGHIENPNYRANISNHQIQNQMNGLTFEVGNEVYYHVSMWDSI